MKLKYNSVKEKKSNQQETEEQRSKQGKYVYDMPNFF